MEHIVATQLMDLLCAVGSQTWTNNSVSFTLGCWVQSIRWDTHHAGLVNGTLATDIITGGTLKPYGANNVTCKYTFIDQALSGLKLHAQHGLWHMDTTFDRDRWLLNVSSTSRVKLPHFI